MPFDEWRRHTQRAWPRDRSDPLSLFTISVCLTLILFRLIVATCKTSQLASSIWACFSFFSPKFVTRTNKYFVVVVASLGPAGDLNQPVAGCIIISIGPL